MKKLLGIMVLIFFWCSNAYAGWTYSQYKEVYLKDKNRAQTYLWGVMTGYRVANSVLNENDKIYCMPKKLPLTLENVENILEAAAQKVENPDDKWVAIMFHFGMQDTFPCE